MAKTIKGGASSSPGRTKAAPAAAPAPAGSGLPESAFKDATHDEMTADFKSSIDSLNSTELSTLKGYTGSDYYGINKMLREEGFDPAKFPGSMKTKQVTNLDSALAKGTLSKNVVLHRGFSSDELESALASGKITKGTTITDPGFMSTSINKSSAFGGSIRYFLYAPKGTKGQYVASKSHYKTEYEFLLPRNTTIMVRSAKKVGHQWYVEAEIIP